MLYELQNDTQNKHQDQIWDKLIRWLCNDSYDNMANCTPNEHMP